ncbi:MAG: phosphotransferase [Sulfobacillus sp.]|nr:phosphotransferase [Sulfobacillus sp.]
MEKVLHSLFAPDALIERIRRGWGISLSEGRLLWRGLNDTYLVTGHHEAVVARLYRAGWRSRGQVLDEHRLLFYLARKGLAVSKPRLRANGSTVAWVKAPEGVRLLSLFSYAAGEPPLLVPETGRRMGQSLAGLHRTLASQTAGRRPYFRRLEGVVHSLWQTLRHCGWTSEEWQRLERVLEDLAFRLSSAPLTGSVVHGDFQPQNVHQVQDRLILLDFDWISEGPWMWDVASFAEAVITECGPDWPGIVGPFIEAYHGAWPRPRQEWHLLPAVRRLRQLWLWALYLRYPEVFGGFWCREGTRRTWLDRLVAPELDYGLTELCRDFG